MAHTHERQIYRDVGGSNDKDVPWFTKDVDDSNIGEAARELLETYSGIPAEEVLPHVLAIVRNKAAFYAIPNNCILDFINPANAQPEADSPPALSRA